MLTFYILNCFLLIVPILLMNAFWMGKLPRIYQPEVFSDRIPVWIIVGENLFRAIVLLGPLCMPLRIVRFGQKVGFAVFLAGVLLYALSWAAQIWLPSSAWSQSRWGFMAPGYTPLVWLIGIALTGDSLYFSIPYSPWIYIGLAVVFLVFHNLHAWIVYSRARVAASNPPVQI